jgi:transcriptional regulator with XRE-family HTH domain
MEELITGTQLAEWRSARNLSLRAVAEMLGVTSPSTINAWENGQDIPGPAQLLLGWLILGKVPFGQEGEAAARVASAAWKIEMTLEAFDKLRAKAMAAGFEDIVDYIAQLVLEDLYE